MTRTQTFTSVTPYLGYPDADAAAEWLIRVLGFGPTRCVREDGRWSEGEIAVGDGHINLRGEGAMGTVRTVGVASGQGALLIIGVSDVDAQYRRIRAAGAPIDPPRDEEYGPRTCHVTDPWGYRWYFWQGEARYPS